MKVAFDRTVDDLVHFNEYHWRHSPGMRRMYRWGFVGAPVSGLVTALLVSRAGLTIAAFAFVAAAVLYSALIAWYSRWSLRWGVRKLLAEGHNKGQLSRHAIEISPQGLTEETAHDQSKQSWTTIERVAEDESYIFIYTQPVAAHIIPKAAFDTPDQAAAFMRAATSFHQAGVAPNAEPAG